MRPARTRSWWATGSRPPPPPGGPAGPRPGARKPPRFPPRPRNRSNCRRYPPSRRPVASPSQHWRSRRCASWPRILVSAWPRWRAAGAGTPARSAESGNGSRTATSAPASGGEERIAVRGVRKHMAAAMVSSAFTAPHVTEFLQADVTETMSELRRVRALPDFAELRVSPLLFVARALLVAVARHPLVNSSWDAAAEEIVVKHYVNLGIAVAAERGLIVPNVKHADALTLPELARALQVLTETGRAGKATPADLAGGTITITNVGVFGVDAGTPILTPGETAILAFGQVKDTPWVVDGELAVRKACTLSLSFDHRIVDGELGSAVLRDVGSMLTDPLRMLAWS